MQPQYMQTVGRSLWTGGVDPVTKYRFPQTMNQNLGWQAKESLEFFGVAKFGRVRNPELTPSTGYPYT